MKRIITYLLIGAASLSCSKFDLFSGGSTAEDDGQPQHDMIVLGEKLKDPYTVDNMTKALQSIAPAGRTTLEPTDFYVRFLPTSDEQLQTLNDQGLELIDHPLDYRIVREGDWYHDPSLPEGDITWQYAVVPVDFAFPKGI